MTHQELRTTSIRAAAVLCAAIVCVFGSEPAFGHNNGAYNYNERSGSISHTSDNAYLHTWMTDLPDTLRLSDLSIPGTHDTMARRNVVLHAKTQSWTLNYQLHAGIRVLDIRCRRVKAIEFDDDGMPGIASIFRIYHGITDQDAQFGKDVLGPCIEFLDDHPGETILMRVMRSEQGSYPWDDRDTPFTETLDEYMDGYGRDYFWSGPGLSTMHSANPELGDIRKKIVILQDFDDYEGSGTHGDYGISFPNGLEFTDESVTLNEQSDLYRQWQMIRDFYNDIEDDAPSADPNDREDDPIYFNALTGSGVGAVFYTIPPSFVASGHFPCRVRAKRG